MGASLAAGQGKAPGRFRYRGTTLVYRDPVPRYYTAILGRAISKAKMASNVDFLIGNAQVGGGGDLHEHGRLFKGKRVARC